jgi:hypothetical protein
LGLNAGLEGGWVEFGFDRYGTILQIFGACEFVVVLFVCHW